MTNFNLSKSELLSLVNEVKNSLQTISQTELAKANNDPLMPPNSPEGSSSRSASPEGRSASPEGSSSGLEGSASPGTLEGDPGAPPTDVPSVDSAGDPAAGDPAAGDQQVPTFEELVGLYSALPPQALEAHAAALQQAMAMRPGTNKGGPSAPPGGPSAPPMGKQEVATCDPQIGLKPGTGNGKDVETANPNIGPTNKSEKDLAARLAKAERDLEAVGRVIETILTAPQRRAVTGLTFVPMRKTEEPLKTAKKPFGELTKSELHAVLVSATDPQNSKLSKAERNVVTEYCLSPLSVDMSSIEAIYSKV